MNDPRLTPDPNRITGRNAAQVIVPLADLHRTPGGARDRQLIFGETVSLLSQNDGWCYVQATKDGYCGYVTSSAFGEISAPTHRVCARATHVYSKPDFKSAEVMSLSFASQLCVGRRDGKFAQIDAGFVPVTHIVPSSTLADDPAAIATLFLGTPYLWGGNSCWGIDCSGLVQASLVACGLPCPGDSDQQQTLGKPAEGPYERNDLLFWKGHVALVTDAGTLIHANAHTMSVTFEPIAEAIKRIEGQGDGPVTAHRRM